jgi:beta-lactamase class A
VKKKKADGAVSDIGVYYRDLNNGPWFGVNERQDFLPASLLKLPLMLNFYKIAETRPQVLQEKLTLQERFPLDGLKQLFPPQQEIQPGTEIHV